MNTLSDKCKIFSGSAEQVERDFNRFLGNLDGSYERLSIAGTKEHLVLLVTYNDTAHKVTRPFY